MTSIEIVKLLLPPFLTALATLLAAGLVGHGLTAKWAERQKRREMVLTATNDFYKLYGEFFAVWKLWNYSLQQSGTSDFDERRWKLLERASAAEASMETAMVKLVSERILTGDEITMLACFRQAYQCLRQAIKNGHKLNWYFDEYPQYLAFKRLATGVSKLVSTGDQTSPPDITEAQNALRTITSNRWEHTWLAVALAEDKAEITAAPTTD
ncbi:MAG: hypothetical protein QOH65_2835 [Methylobacteriaceae bacterium]|jgi:hypothetical protein|nr:hypothetical protein [Methylobacteriaceae bacterium]